MQYSFTSATNDPLIAAVNSILDEAKAAADPANLKSIITNHTALLRKATTPDAKKFHQTAIANAKEKLNALGEDVDEPSEGTKKQIATNQISRLTKKIDEAYDINAETRKIELTLSTLRESFKGFSPFYKELVKKDKSNEKILLAMLKNIRDTESLMDDIVFSDLKKGKFSESTDDLIEAKKTVKQLAVGDKVHGYTNNNQVVKTVKQKIANRNNYFKLVFDDGSDAILHAGHEFEMPNK